MGFNKRYIDEERIFSTYKQDGAEGVANLYIKADAVIMQDKVAEYIGIVLEKNIYFSDRLHLIDVYMNMRLEGLLGKNN